MTGTKKILGTIFHGPSDWIVGNTKARDRRSFGFWTAAVSIALLPVFGSAVFFVSILSVLALIPNFTAETPTEDEE